VTVVDLTNVPPTSVTLSLANYNISTNTATFNFSPATLPNGNYRATLLAAGITDAAGNELDGNGDGTGGDNYVYDFFFLRGDANRDRIVDIVDLGIIGTNWQLSGKTWAQGDFNGDSLVDIVDLGMIGSNWQKRVARPGDANHDGIVDIVDLGIVGTNWQGTGKSWEQGDFTGDGLVDIVDLGMIGTYWQVQVPAPSMNQSTLEPVADSAASMLLDDATAQELVPTIIPTPSKKKLALPDEQIIQHRRIHRPDIFSRRPIRLAGSRR
jgi:hypothetical protein